MTVVNIFPQTVKRTPAKPKQSPATNGAVLRLRRKDEGIDAQTHWQLLRVIE
jgi:hypothetical protein